MAGITYKINADGSGYTKTLNSMRGDTEKFGSDVKGQMVGIGGALKAAFAYVGVASFKGILDEITELSRLARGIGDDFQGFQTITNAARQFGIEAETVADAIKDLDVKMTDGALGAKAYAEVFDLVGISLEEAMGMTQLERFYAFADAVQAADGQISSFSADEINDAMFRMVPLLEKGSAGIKSLGNEFVKYTDAQREMAEKGSVAWDNITQSLKWLVATVAGEVIPFLQKLAHTVGAVIGDMAIQFGLFNKGMMKLFSGDFAGAKAAFDTLGEMTRSAVKRIKDEIADVWADTEENPKKGTGGGSNVQTNRSKESGDKLEEEVNKQLEEQEKRRQALMDDEEKLLDIQKRRIAAERELGELGERLHKDGATDEEALQLEEAKTKWEKLQTEEQKLQLEIQKKKEAEAERQRKKDESKREKDKREEEDRSKEFDESSDKEADIRAEIEAEKRGREEIGMTDEQILKRRREELAQMQKDLTTGTFGGPEDVAEAELAISKKKTEIDQLAYNIAQDDDKTDPQTSIISSSLASIGGGGGTASFGNDPMLSESKKQSNLLEQLVSLQGGTIEGGGNLVVPEL